MLKPKEAQDVGVLLHNNLIRFRIHLHNLSKFLNNIFIFKKVVIVNFNLVKVSLRYELDLLHVRTIFGHPIFK